MKRIIQAAVAAIFLSAVGFLAGCTTTQIQNAQVALKNACSVVNPTIRSLSTVAQTPGALLAPYATQITKLAADNDKVCKAIAGLPAQADMKTLASTDIPAVLTAVAAALPPTQANTVQGALIVYQVAVNAAIASGSFQ